jgi:hypothetical protein
MAGVSKSYPEWKEIILKQQKMMLVLYRKISEINPAIYN